jgi:hypothetical protein
MLRRLACVDTESWPVGVTTQGLSPADCERLGQLFARSASDEARASLQLSPDSSAVRLMLRFQFSSGLGCLAIPTTSTGRWWVGGWV